MEEFLQYAKNGGDLRSSKIKSSWRTHIKRHFGDYTSLLKEYGFDFENIHGRKHWDKERVITEIQKRYREGKPMNPKSIRDDTALRGACETYFGNVTNAIASAGLDAEHLSLLTFWDREHIKKEFTKYLAEHDDAYISQISREYKSLDHAIRKHYGGYAELCDDIGIDIKLVKRQEREWSKGDFLNVLIELRDSGQSLNISNVLAHFPTAYEVSKRYFGSYENAVKAIGEDPVKYVDGLKVASYFGFKFEQLLKEMFDALGKDYLYQKRYYGGKIRPDFVDEENNVFIDAKLSSWTVFHSKTHDKYLPHCSKLVIVYLRGNTENIELESTELRHVSYYYDELRRKGLSEFIEKFDELLAKLNEKEAVA